MAYLLTLRIKTAYNMRLKIVLHIKIQFVSSDFLIFNETHFRNLGWSEQAFFRHLAVNLIIARRHSNDKSFEFTVYI